MQICKNDVDSYQPGTLMPCFQLWAEVNVGFAASNAAQGCPITVIGAKWPYCTFTIQLPPPGGLGMHICVYVYTYKKYVHVYMYMYRSQLPYMF